MSSSSKRANLLPLKSILKKSVGSYDFNADMGDNFGDSSLDYARQEYSYKNEETEEEREKVFKEDYVSNRESRSSFLGSESFYGESLLGLGFDSLGVDSKSNQRVEPKGSYFRASTYTESPTLPEPTAREELSNSARAKFEKSILLASNPNYLEEELEMRRLAEFVLGDAGLLETNSSDEEDDSTKSPFSLSFDNLSLFNVSPREELRAPGSGRMLGHDIEESPASSFSNIKTPPLTNGSESSVISLPPVSPQFSPPTLQSHPDSPAREFKFKQSFSSGNLPNSPPLLPPTISDSSTTPKNLMNERRFSQSVAVEESYMADEVSPLSHYTFPDATTTTTEKKTVKARPPPLSLVMQSLSNLPTPGIISTPTTTSHLLSPTSNTSTPSLLRTASSDSTSSILTPRMFGSDSKSSTTLPDFFDIIPDNSSIKTVDRIPGYGHHTNSKRPNKIPPLSAELVASLLSSSTGSNNSNSTTTLRKKLSHPDLSKSLPHSISTSQPSSPTFPPLNLNAMRSRNFSEPMIPQQSIIAFPIFVPPPPLSASTISPLSPALISAPISPPIEISSLPLSAPVTSSFQEGLSPPTNTNTTKESFQPLPMNSPSQVLNSPQGTYSPTGQPFVVWGSLVDDLNTSTGASVNKEEEEEKEEMDTEMGSNSLGIPLSSGMVKGLSQSSGGSGWSSGKERGGGEGDDEDEEEEDDVPLARKPGALKLQKKMREGGNYSNGNSSSSSSTGGRKSRKASDASLSSSKISNPISQDPSRPIIPRSMMMDGLDDIPLASLASQFGNHSLTLSPTSTHTREVALLTSGKVPPTRPQRSPLDSSDSLVVIATSPTLSERNNPATSIESSLSRSSNPSGSQIGPNNTSSRNIGSNPMQKSSSPSPSLSQSQSHSLPQQTQIPLQHHHRPPPSLANQQQSQNQTQPQPPQQSRPLPTGPPPRRPSRVGDPILPLPLNNSMQLQSQPQPQPQPQVELRTSDQPVKRPQHPSSHHQHQHKDKSPTSSTFPLPIQELNAIPHTHAHAPRPISNPSPTLPPHRKLSILPIDTNDTIPSTQPPSPSILSNSTNSLTPVPLFSRPPASNILTTEEHRIFILDHNTHFVVKVSQTTRCGEIVMGARNRGLLVTGSEAEGGFALWEICRGLGVERPIREFESLADVIASWNNEVNILVIRRTPLSPLLSVYAKSPKISVSKSAYVQLRMKGKWSKRYLELKNGAVFHSKSENGKDFTLLCQLSAFDVFFVAQHSLESLKAPKPFVLALKSLLPRVHYEDAADYCYYASVKTDVELQAWVKILTEARNVFVRQREQVLISQRAEAGLPLTSTTIPPTKLLDNIPIPPPRTNPPPPLSRPVDPVAQPQPQPQPQTSTQTQTQVQFQAPTQTQIQTKSPQLKSTTPAHIQSLLPPAPTRSIQTSPAYQPVVARDTSKLPPYIHPQFQTRSTSSLASGGSTSSESSSIRKLGSTGPNLHFNPNPPPLPPLHPVKPPPAVWNAMSDQDREAWRVSKDVVGSVGAIRFGQSSNSDGSNSNNVKNVFLNHANGRK